MALQRPLESIGDDALLARLADVAGQARRVESSLVAHIAEVDRRRLFARYACPSMFVYCTRVLHLAEGEAFRRIRVARASRRHPVLLEMLADGRLHVSGIAILVPFLTASTRDRLLALSVHKTKREIEKLVAALHPRSDVSSVMRKLPERRAAPIGAQRVELFPAPAPADCCPDPTPDVPQDVDCPPSPVSDSPTRPISAPLPVVEPLSASRYKIQFTAGEELRDALERLRALLRSEITDGDVGAIVGKAVRELRKRLDARRYAQTSAPRKSLATTDTRSSSRDVPAAVRRVAYRRDEGQCRFIDLQGRRCPERHQLEYHHRYAFALGGGHEAENICLMCPAHNRYLAEIDFGTKVMSQYLNRRDRPHPARERRAPVNCSRDEQPVS